MPKAKYESIYLQIRKDITVVMVAPKCPGTEVRNEYVRGFGVPTLIAVHPENDPKVARALGWDTYYSAPFMSGDIFETQNLRGHSGYTGTSVLIDPETSTILIILTHRVHPKDKGSVSRMRGIIASITASAIND